jgi:predicted nucleotidyltransferase
MDKRPIKNISREREGLVRRIREILRGESMVKFGYVFGSVAAGSPGPLSDIDVAVYLDARADAFSFRAALMERLVRGLGLESVDLVPLNGAPAALRYSVISSGEVVKDDKARRVQFETATLSEYLDFSPFRDVQSAAIRRHLESGEYFG